MIVYDEIEKTVTEGDWDGFHSGFPCSSFSRVRWRDSPVRSAAHIYGLPGTPSQQREADEGALMAACSGWLHQKQVESFQRRAVPEASTMENKPDTEHTGSAWGLPELQAVIADTNSSSVEFNTCAYQTKLNGTSQQDGPANWSRLDRWQGSAHANLGSKTYRWWARKILRRLVM